MSIGKVVVVFISFIFIFAFAFSLTPLGWELGNVLAETREKNRWLPKRKS